MITQDSIEALKARLDVVDVVGSYIELKKAGANFKAPCPFHDEKSPSFVVSPSKQIYHCFGCGAGGDSVKFVMEYEKLNYPEALEKLASSYNFTLSYSDNKDKRVKSQIFDVMSKWYKNLLESNQEALNYLRERGVYESSIENFGIGYAPSSQQTLSHINSQMLNMNEAIEAGIVGYDEQSRRSYARFIERIIFPISATNGSIVGFGGRTISGHQAKYINSPETPFFNKSRLLYAYHLARQDIYKRKEMIVTEGYLDVIMLHQAGFTNAVATLGTALTQEHLPLLRKGEPRIVMAYDGDKAGRQAALKASRLLSVAGFDGGVVIFNDGVDPADMVKEGRIEELAHIFRQTQPFIEFVLSEILSLYDLNNPKAKESAMNEATAYLKTLSSILQESYKPYLASRLGVSPSLVRIAGARESSQPTLMQKNTHKDMWELSLVKTIMEYPERRAMILDILDPQLLKFHFHEFSLALQNNYDDPSLMAISIDQSIKALESEEEIKAELNSFLKRHFERELKQLSMKRDISFEEKAFLIRQLRGKIASLAKEINV